MPDASVAILRHEQYDRLRGSREVWEFPFLSRRFEACEVLALQLRDARRSVLGREFSLQRAPEGSVNQVKRRLYRCVARIVLDLLEANLHRLFDQGVVEIGVALLFIESGLALGAV